MRTLALTVPVARAEAPSLVHAWGFTVWRTPGSSGRTLPLTAEVDYSDGTRETIVVREGVYYSSGVRMDRVWFVSTSAGPVLVDVGRNAADLIVPALGPAQYETTVTYSDGQDFAWQGSQHLRPAVARGCIITAFGDHHSTWEINPQPVLYAVAEFGGIEPGRLTAAGISLSAPAEGGAWESPQILLGRVDLTAPVGAPGTVAPVRLPYLPLRGIYLTWAAGKNFGWRSSGVRVVWVD